MTQFRGNVLKRYSGDNGRITNYHFSINSDNIIPILREIDQSRFT